jgi:hypothetical protein
MHDECGAGGLSEWWLAHGIGQAANEAQRGGLDCAIVSSPFVLHDCTTARLHDCTKASDTHALPLPLLDARKSRRIIGR